MPSSLRTSSKSAVGFALTPAMCLATAMLSRALRFGSRLNFWKTKPTVVFRIRVRPPSLRCARSWPATWTSPEVGGVRPPMMWKSVDLPEPEGPMMETNSPGRTARSTPRSAGTSTLPTRYVLVSSWTRMMAASLIGQRLDGIVSGRGQPGIQRAQLGADQRDACGDRPPFIHDDHREGRGHERVDQPVGAIAHDDSENAAADPEHHRLHEDDAQDEGLGAAEAFQDADFA